MNIYKKALAVLLAGSIIFALASCSGTSESAEKTVSSSTSDATTAIVWDYLDLDSASHPMVILLNEWSDEIYEKTDGQLKINIRVGGELPFTTAEYLDAVSAGSVQMAGCMVTAISSYLQAGGLPGCPYMTTDIDSYNRVMEILTPYLDEELASYNVFNAMNLFYPTQDIYGSGKTPTNYKDMAGMKLRTSGAEQAKFWQAVGLLPTSIDAAEVSSALNTNVINGVTTATMAVEMNKWYESVDWIYMCNSMIIPVYAVVNQDAFDALPTDVQEVFLSVTENFTATFAEKMQEASDNSLAALEQQGLEVVWATDEEKAELLKVAVPLWDEYAVGAGSSAEEALSAIKAVLGI